MSVPQQIVLPTYNKKQIMFKRGYKTRLYDTNENEYLDMCAGVAVTNLGHSNQNILNAIISQADTLLHCSNYFYNEHELRCASFLQDRVKCEMPDARVFFCNSGTEAVESALKFSILRNRDTKLGGNILAMMGSFHGRTCGSLSCTYNPSYRENFLDHLNPKVFFWEFNKVEGLEEFMIENDIGIVITELVQGEGGVMPITHNFCNTLISLHAKRNFSLIIDEVQTGVGRTGSFYCFQQFNLKPNFVTTAKGLGNGMPIGAVICDGKFNITYGQHGSTYGGNPLCTRIASIVIHSMDNDFLEGVAILGDYFIRELKKIESKFIKEVRGMGMLIGVEIQLIDVNTVIESLLRSRIVCISAGKNTLRLCPPLIIKKEEIDYFTDALENALNNIELWYSK